MEEKIIEIIREKLTEKEVGIVKDVFNQNENLKTLLSDLEKDYAALDLRYSEALHKIGKYTAIETETQKLEELNKTLSEEKTKLEIEKIKLDIERARVKEDAMRYVFETVFKVPSVREKYQEIVTSYGYQNGTYSATGTHQQPMEKTITQE